ncbi:nucleoside triphosphate pyrophosphohydrolase [Deinococcus sp. QL22]|uniref:nucleoside triphosphate pyrophosphohydrolase n=1 Tax=Deinococcus sp. QL22 TaxID=2939437 RepID=UPI0020175B3D|nr:nucleoside triphosphate pyrophosphohydrolase [Deinococcus sp. QL22]UQN05391.1 nucleoside triphosphate pyrophosphohydrolase [Deinococcus sp. QL22]
MGKLVRDSIPALVGAGAVARVLDADEYAVALQAKLNEEVAEYLAAHDPEELADVLEVLHTLAALHGLTPQELEAKRAAKADARGGFGGRVWMEF